MPGHALADDDEQRQRHHDPEERQRQRLQGRSPLSSDRRGTVVAPRLDPHTVAEEPFQLGFESRQAAAPRFRWNTSPVALPTEPANL